VTALGSAERCPLGLVRAGLATVVAVADRGAGLDRARADFAETVRGDGPGHLTLLVVGGCAFTAIRPLLWVLGARRR
jgi:hypothetical protein